MSADLNSFLCASAVVHDDRAVTGEWLVGKQHLNGKRVAQGGLIVTFADFLVSRGVAKAGATARVSATVELKVNFFASLGAGKATGRATAIHAGRSTQVWQTEIFDAAGKRVALVIQTQIHVPTT